jgi:hypothetical protein
MEMFVAVAGFVLTTVMLVLISSFIQRAFGQRVRTRQEKVAILSQGQRWHKRNTRALWGLILLALAYSSLLHYLYTLTGVAMLDGSIGLALGLFICSHPAANAVNLLFFERDRLRQLSEWSIVGWLALNLVVLLVGWMVVFDGIRRLIRPE